MTTTAATQPVTITPMPEGWTYPGQLDEPATQSTAWIYVILDVHRRNLSVTVRMEGESYDKTAPSLITASCCVKLPAPEGRTVSHDWLAVPDRISFLLNNHRTRDAIHDFLQTEVVPLAQEIVDSLIPVPGTDEFDWTPDAVEAAQELRFVCDYPHGVPVANDAGETMAQQRAMYRSSSRRRRYLAATRLFEVRPDLAEKAWAGMSDERLNERADILARFLVHWNTRSDGRLYEQLGYQRKENGEWPWVHLIGLRAYMFGYRQQVAGNLTVQNADGWYARPDYTGDVHADLTDAEVAALAEKHTNDALCEGLLLIGAADWIRTRRDYERTVLRDSLIWLGSEYAVRKAALDEIQGRRAARLAQIISWRVPADTDAELGRLAKMSHTGVAKLREKLADDPDGNNRDE